MNIKHTKDIERATRPEDVGVSSIKVAQLIDDFIQNGQEIHSLMLLRHGKIACELYREPFNADSNHAMYSVSKSVTSTAIGLAIDEKLITLDTKLIDIFPEFAPKKPDENLDKLTIYNLITMRSGKSVNPLADKEKDWIKTFFDSSWCSEPGTEFLYVNENIYMLCAVIHRVTGQSVVEYLTPRLFEPLGIDVPYWETCPRGIEAGGWGLFLKTSDLAKIMLCYQQMGIYAGRRILPEQWVKDATALQADSGQSQSASDSVVGYGYCFWRCAGYENAYRADGLFSQFGIVFEDLDACLICTGGDIGTQQMRDTIWRHVPDSFFDGESDEPSVELSIPAYEMLPEKPRSPLEKALEGKKIAFGKSVVLNAAGFPTSVIPFPAVFMEKDRAGNITDVYFRFEESTMDMTWTEGDETNTIMIGLDGKYRITPIVLGNTHYTAYSHAAWQSENELEIRIRLIEAVAERILSFKFRGNRVTLKPSSLPTIQQISETFKSKIRDVIKQPVIQPLLTEAVPRLASVIDNPLRGSITSVGEKDAADENDAEDEHSSIREAVEILRTHRTKHTSLSAIPTDGDAVNDAYADTEKAVKAVGEKQGVMSEAVDSSNEVVDELTSPLLDDDDVVTAEVAGFMSKVLQYFPKKSQKRSITTLDELKKYIDVQLIRDDETESAEFIEGYKAALADILEKIDEKSKSNT